MKKVLVIGDCFLDEYLHGSVDRISPEAPVPVLKHAHTEFRAGGAANVALNIKALGAEVELVGGWSYDDSGSRLTEILDRVGVRTSRIEFPTIRKVRYVSENHQLLRVDYEIEPPKKLADDAFESLSAIVSDYEIVVISDYGKGICEQYGDGAKRIIDACKGKTILVDPTGRKTENYTGATLVKPNAKEYALLARGKQPQKVISAMGIENLLVTDGARGMTLHQKGRDPIQFDARAQEVVDVTGAGDTVMATLAWALARGDSLVDACTKANIAAGIAVSRFGCATVTADEIVEEL